MKTVCPHPGCKGNDFIEMRPLYRFDSVFRWWCFWKGVRLLKVRSGSQVMCSSCLGHSNATQAGLEIMFRPQPNPQQDDAPMDRANGKARAVPRFADLGAEP